MLDANCGLTSGSVAALVADVELPHALDLVVIGARGVQGLTTSGPLPLDVETPEFAAGRVPLDHPRAAVRTSDGGFAVVTTHGRFDPGYVNDPLQGLYADGGRRSAQILAALDLAYYLTADPRYLEAKRGLIDDFEYDENVIHEADAPFRQGDKSGDGDELATQAFFVLLRYESEPDLRSKWIAGWNNTYGYMRAQQGALWDLVNGGGRRR